MTHDELAAIEIELNRQDTDFAGAEEALRALGDVAIAVPEAFFEELDSVSEPPMRSGAVLIQGVRA